MDSVPLFRAYLFSFLFFMLGAGLVLRATGKTIDTLKAFIYSSIVGLPATYFLIRSFGVWGAMGGALLSIILPKVLIIFFEIRLLKIKIRNYFPWKNFVLIFLISGLSIIPFILAEYFFNTGIILVMFLGIVYLIIVSLLELKFNVFVLDYFIVRQGINALILKSRLFKKFDRN
jgi:O-antigen/teichoic acid export membrane protein